MSSITQKYLWWIRDVTILDWISVRVFALRVNVQQTFGQCPTECPTVSYWGRKHPNSAPVGHFVLLAAGENDRSGFRLRNPAAV